jgi:hypothetical protein
MIGRRALIGALLGGRLAATAWAQDESSEDEFGMPPVRPVDDAIRASGGFALQAPGYWVVDIRPGEGEFAILRTVRRRRRLIYDRSADIPMPVYRRLRDRAIEDYRLEKEADAQRQANAAADPDKDGVTLPALCLDGDYANVEMGAVPGETNGVLLDSSCFSDADAAGRIAHRMLALARQYAP